VSYIGQRTRPFSISLPLVNQGNAPHLLPWPTQGKPPPRTPAFPTMNEAETRPDHQRDLPGLEAWQV
jgi:hypothetical protein